MEKNSKKYQDGFGVPEGYFENFEENIKNLVELKERMPEKEGFQVPEGYFESFDTDLNDYQEDEKKVFHLKHYRKYIVYAAAVIALLISGTWLITYNSNPLSMEELKAADVEWLIDNGNLEIPESYLIENAQLSDLAAISITDSPIDLKALEEYVLDETDIYEFNE